MGTLEEKLYLVSWNLTSRCNLSCPHCYQDAGEGGRRGGSELTTEEARFVIDELSYLSERLMLVLSGGEPLLREDLPDLVEYSTRAGFITVLGSNGTLLSRQVLRELKAAGLKGAGISVDSTRPALHDSFRGRQGAWELSVNALREAREAGIETQLDVTLTDRNWEEIGGFVELGASLGARAVNFFFLVCTGRAARSSISTSSYESALRRIAAISGAERRLLVRARCAPHIYRFLHDDGTLLPPGTRGCLAGRHYLRIDPRGDVTPCPYLPLPLGNVREKSLTALWEESPGLKRLRTGEYGGRCGGCEYAEICGGCRARAFVEKGDFMGEDPLCRYLPPGRPRVRTGDAFPSAFPWEEEARQRVQRIPFFMQGMIIRMIEAVARQRGLSSVTAELLDELKTRAHPGGPGNS